MAKDQTPAEQLATIGRAIDNGTIDSRFLSREAMYLLIIRYLQEHVSEDIRIRANEFVGMF